ncbi:uncharacterized protein LOC132713090 [Ruditapes philippinarum]|uniref:uncharacterized protein LOC132713090 n=1 Tax=Ruditapes philippinarum TaxID=129788 RepID=UPI00295B8ED8|nr:uncharacterized protein LOC132713090 [Ruditapes philippinarum]
MQIQNDAPIPEAFPGPGSLTCQVFKHSYKGPRFKVSSERLYTDLLRSTQDLLSAPIFNIQRRQKLRLISNIISPIKTYNKKSEIAQANYQKKTFKAAIGEIHCPADSVKCESESKMQELLGVVWLRLDLTDGRMSAEACVERFDAWRSQLLL